jgi:hypothetical protein
MIQIVLHRSLSQDIASPDVRQEEQGDIRPTVDGKGKAPPSVRRMWLMALRFCEATRVVMPSLHSETSEKSTHRALSVFESWR